MRGPRRHWAVIGIAVLAGGLLLLDSKPPTEPAWTGSPLGNVILRPDERILILAPHPDDEALGCGGIVQKAVAMNVPVHIVFLTYGDFYEWSFVVYKKRPVLTPKGVEGMGELRHDEAIAAAALGLARNDLTFLGYPDFGTLDIWYSAWENEPPVKGVLTKAMAVPHKDALRPGAPYKGEKVLRDLTSLIRQFRPTKILVSHPADHHPDHRSLYLFTRVCLFDFCRTRRAGASRR